MLPTSFQIRRFRTREVTAWLIAARRDLGQRPTRRITPEDLLLLAMPAAAIATT